MGEAYWAIGAERFGAVIERLDTDLKVSTGPIDVDRHHRKIEGINCALENTVSRSSSSPFPYIGRVSRTY